MSLQVNDYVLLMFLVLAAFFDLTRQKIPNFLTLPVIGWGLASHTYTGSLDGLQFSFFGLLLGLAIFIVPYAMGWLGGGDVKMLGAVGALKGAAFLFHAALFTAVCGGVIAVIYLLASGKLPQVLKKLLGTAWRWFFGALALRFRSPWFTAAAGFFLPTAADTREKSTAMPYGIAIALGTVFALSGLLSFF